MTRHAVPRIAIVDYGMGNLYSVQRACLHAGADAVITSAPDEVAAANGVVLPGVGAMPDAMRVLNEIGLADAIRYVSGRGTPLLGVCLGLQLLMREGSEFGRHEGLGLIDGTVIRFAGTESDGSPLRIPHIGWSAVRRPTLAPDDLWQRTPLEDAADGTFMYFVHSYYVVPADTRAIVATSRYGETDFCSVLQKNNLFACQFHPERSGPQGLLIIRNFVACVARAAHAPR